MNLAEQVEEEVKNESSIQALRILTLQLPSFREQEKIARQLEGMILKSQNIQRKLKNGETSKKN